MAMDATDYPEGLFIPTEFYLLAKSLPAAQRRKLIDAGCCLFFDGFIPDDLPPAVKIAFNGWDGRFVRKRERSDGKRAADRAKAERESQEKGTAFESRSEKGSKSSTGNAVENSSVFSVENSEANSQITAETLKTLVNDFLQIETEETKTKAQRRKMEKPPTLEEVRRYFAATGVVECDPDEFFDYYDSRGWKNKYGRGIYDWRGLVQQWRKTEGKYPGASDRSSEGRENGKKPKRRLAGTVASGPEKGTWLYSGGPEGVGRLGPDSIGMSEDEAQQLLDSIPDG